MGKIIYGFILYLLFFALFESYGQFMFSKNSLKAQLCSIESNGNSNIDQNQCLILNCYYSGIYADGASDLSPHFGDLVFNEVMADPTPVVKLPNAEFIELKNASGLPINIKNWILAVNGRQKVLPDQLIEADGFIILCGKGGNEFFESYGANIEIAGFSLPNDGFNLKLFSAEKNLIDSLNYSPEMQREGFSNGGYSLERIDPHRWCGAESNWETSVSENGGTPGTENSVFGNNPDYTPPSVVSVALASPELLEVVVSEIPDNASISGSIFSFVPALPPSDSIRFDIIHKKYSVYFPVGSLVSGAYYNLIIKGLTDECGNTAAVGYHEFWYYLPKPGDLLISEVLFNPFPGGVDFVEIFNHSGYRIHLEDLYLASLDNAQKIKALYPLSVQSDVLQDAQFAAFTTDPATLLSNYNSLCPDCIYGMDKLPTYNQDEGWVVLVNKEMTIIDEFHYLAQMHDPLLSDVKGISLERKSFSRPADDPLNWHSASATVGFATPGYRNSAAEDVSEKSPMIIIEPRTFSPNGDGFNDRLLIKFSPGESGWIANIRVYDESGLEIRRLANNLMIGSQDVVDWDGTKENHQKAGLGIYIVTVDLFGLQSGMKHFKAACVLTDRLE